MTTATADIVTLSGSISSDVINLNLGVNPPLSGGRGEIYGTLSSSSAVQIAGGAAVTRSSFTMMRRFRVALTYDGGSGTDTLWLDTSAAHGVGHFGQRRGFVADAAFGAVQFSNVEHLTGGSGADDFVFPSATTAVSGVLDGQGGADWLDYSALILSVNVDLFTGLASATGGTTRIENVAGGDGADVIWGDDGDNILQGGWGDDTLAGRGGRDALDGGSGNDSLDGGADQDKLYATSDAAFTLSNTSLVTTIAGISYTDVPRVARIGRTHGQHRQQHVRDCGLDGRGDDDRRRWMPTRSMSTRTRTSRSVPITSRRATGWSFIPSTSAR